MTQDEFNALSVNERAEAVWRGTFLGDRPESGYRVLLYSLTDLYVEVFYEMEANKIADLRPFTDKQKLVPYLAQIKLI